MVGFPLPCGAGVEDFQWSLLKLCAKDINAFNHMLTIPMAHLYAQLQVALG